jgi:hypothetical protein
MFGQTPCHNGSKQHETRCTSTSPRKPSFLSTHLWGIKGTWEQETSGNDTLDNADKGEAPPLVTQMRWMLTPSTPGTPSVRRRNDDLWQKGNVSSANNKDTCLETVQRSPVAQTLPLPTPSPHEAHHPLREPKPHEQTMKKQLSPHQNQRKELMMSSTPSDISTRESDKS